MTKERAKSEMIGQQIEMEDAIREMENCEHCNPFREVAKKRQERIQKLKNYIEITVEAENSEKV
jgi:hypothetical protein